MLKTFVLTLLLLGSVAAQSLETAPLRSSRDRENYRRIVRLLGASSMTVDWRETSLEDAVRTISRWTGVNFVFSREGKEFAEETVGLQLRDVSALTLLKIVKERMNLSFQQRYGVVFVTTPEHALKSSLVLGIFGVADLLYVPPDFPAPRRGFGIPIGIPGEREMEEESERENRSGDELVDIVRSATGGDAAWSAEGVSITASRNRIIVRHTPAMMRRVHRLLRQLRGVW